MHNQQPDPCFLGDGTKMLKMVLNERGWSTLHNNLNALKSALAGMHRNDNTSTRHFTGDRPLPVQLGIAIEP